MFEWLSSLPTWFQIIFAILSLSSTVMALFFIVKKGITFSKGNGGILGFNIGVTENKKKSPHANCQHSKDISILITEILRLSKEQWFHIEKTKTKLQMNYAEQKLDQWRSYMTKLYIETMVQKTNEIVGNPSISIYRMILREIQNNLTSIFRVSFREDEFHVMNERNYENYFEDKFEFVISRIAEMMDDNYFYEKDITRSQVHKIHQDAIPKTRDILKDIFTHARMVSMDINVKILEYEERIQQTLSKYLME